MRRTILMITAVLMTATAIMAQPPRRPQKMKKNMHAALAKERVTFYKEQQEKLVSVLNDDEKKQLEEIRKEFDDFRNQGKQIRESMEGHYNPDLAKIRKESFEKIIAQADTLLRNHPDAVEAYEKALEAEKEKRDKRWNEVHPSAKGERPEPPFMKRLDNPAFLLLWDEEHMPRFRAGKGMKRGRAMNHPCLSPETRQKLLAYAKENILPVIKSERDDFEKSLSAKEKKKIEKARALRTERKKMFAQKRKNFKENNFQTADDSVRIAMRLEMEKAMIPVREIALNHYGEIEKHLNNIRENFPGWKKELAEIAGHPLPPKGATAGFHKRLGKLNNPVTFLLFDETLFGFDNTGEDQ